MVRYPAPEPIWPFCIRSEKNLTKMLINSEHEIGKKNSLFEDQESMYFANLSIKEYVNIYFLGIILNKVRRWGYSLSPWTTFNTNITPSNGKLSLAYVKPKIKGKMTMFLTKWKVISTSEVKHLTFDPEKPITNLPNRHNQLSQEDQIWWCTQGLTMKILLPWVNLSLSWIFFSMQ